MLWEVTEFKNFFTKKIFVNDNNNNCKKIIEKL